MYDLATTRTTFPHRSRGTLGLRTLGFGLLASGLSTVALGWRGRHEDGSAVAPINAVSHWAWGDEALAHDEPNARYTALGAAIHAGSSMLWAGLYAWIRGRRAHPTLVNAACDAAAVTAVAAVVDLKLTPQRFTPGFERRLTTRSLVQVYGAFAAGLLLGGAWVLRR